MVHNNHSPTERSPLLGNEAQPTNGHAVEPTTEQASPAQDGASEIALAEEPSTVKLITTMLAIWIGVFFAALGNLLSPFPLPCRPY